MPSKENYNQYEISFFILSDPWHRDGYQQYYTHRIYNIGIIRKNGMHSILWSQVSKGIHVKRLDYLYIDVRYYRPSARTKQFAGAYSKCEYLNIGRVSSFSSG